MSAAKHTPGPWVANWTVLPDFPNHIAVKIDSEDYTIAVYVNRPAPGRAGDFIADSEENIANARLIAAAPDMLEAAQAAWNCIAELSPTLARVETAQLLQAAIAKATGSAS